jgi:hypothetical protein
MFTMGMDSS